MTRLHTLTHKLKSLYAWLRRGRSVHSLYIHNTRIPSLSTTPPHEATQPVRGASSNYSHLEVTPGPPCCRFICHRQRVGARERKASRTCWRAPRGNGIMHSYSDSSGRRALQRCSSGSSGHPGRLGAIIGPDL